MSETLTSDILRQSGRFLRSVDLVRDFEDPQALTGYWLTDFASRCLEQIGDSFRQGSTKRAWRLTGDFGSGKSSFALLLANSVRESQNRLPKQIRSRVYGHLPIAKSANFLPVLVTGSREPISLAVVRAIHKALSDLSTRGAKSALLIEMERALSKKTVSDKQAVEFLEQSNATTIKSGKADGILLILDEVGKFLEFAAMRPEEQDVYFLQQLAETACRSGKHPLVVVCLLHQGITAYAEQLAKATRQEWDKIAGRFEEITFLLPLDQIARLVSQAINPEVDKLSPAQRKQARDAMEKAISLGWYGTSSSRDTLREVSERLYPIDPLALPVMVRFFRRFGQNERSLFGFLQSHEPFGLQNFIQRPFHQKSAPFRLADFYDYARANFGHHLATASYRTHWSVIESCIENFPAEGAAALAAMKSIGLLNLLHADDLLPTAEAVSWTVCGNSLNERVSVENELKVVAKTTRLHFRGEGRGYSIWPHTSIDLDSRVQESRVAVHAVGSISKAIQEILPSEPIVARRHYIETGNLRYFEVVYCDPSELANLAADYHSQADGFILIPLCETPEETRTSKSVAKRLDDRPETIRLIAVPEPLNRLHSFVLEAKRWDWIQNNTKELNNDAYARDEVGVHLRHAQSALNREVQAMLGRNRHSGKSSLKWFYRDHEGRSDGKYLTARQTLELLSQLCDVSFSEAPLIKNELVNRHNISSAAAAARMRLVELMFSSSDKADLGLPTDRKPPEKSMYFSVLRRTKLHREVNGRWHLGLPRAGGKAEDPCRVRPVLKTIRSILSEKPDQRIGIDTIMRILRQPPFGLRDGLFPILLAVVAVEDEQEVAFYENGTFLREVGKDAFLRMTKAPEKFEIQHCKIEGVRGQLFHQLAHILEVSRSDQKNVELLDLVRSLCQFVAQLPDFARQTRRLENPNTIAVRDVILQAREPVRMVFHDLPEACGFKTFEVGKPTSAAEAQQFVSKLKDAIDELRDALPALHRRTTDAIAEEFGYKGTPLSHYRRKLAGRAEKLLLRVTENKLKAFAFRVFDEGLSETEWLNSVGSVLALRPPDKWKDEDEETFRRELENAAGRFKRAESAAFGLDAIGQGGQGLRVAITQANGNERQEVVHIDVGEEKLLLHLQEQILSVIKQNERLGIAAVSRALWSQLKPVEDAQ